MKIVLMLLLLAPALALANEPTNEFFGLNKIAEGERVSGLRSFYDWGRARDGFGYCYEWAYPGAPLNEGQPVNNYFCERVNPSRYDWGRARNGFGYCFKYTPYGVPMEMGQPQNNYFCERVAPSHYRWSRGGNGYTYCYQYTAKGAVMNDGQPVNNYFCQRGI